jgi:hypothetical protein
MNRRRAQSAARWCTVAAALAAVGGASGAALARVATQEAGRTGNAGGMERAAAALSGLQGADRALLVGVPTRAERAAAGLAGSRSADWLEDARRELSRRLAVIAQLKAARPADAETLRAEEERIKRDEQGARLPLLRGRALALRGMAYPAGAERAGWRDGAIDSLRLAEPASTAAEGLRRVTLAHLLADTGQVDEALELAESVMDLPVGEDAERSVPPGVMVEALARQWLLRGAETDADGQRLLAALTTGPMAAWARGDASLPRLVAEVRARRAAERLAGAGGDANGEALSAALRPLVELGLAGDDAGAAQAAAERVDGLLEFVPEERWPAEGRYAAGLAALGRGGGGSGREVEAGLRWLDALRAQGVRGEQGAWAARAGLAAGLWRLERAEPASAGAGVNGLKALALERAEPWSARAAGALLEALGPLRERAERDAGAWLDVERAAARAVLELSAGGVIRPERAAGLGERLVDLGLADADWSAGLRAAVEAEAGLKAESGASGRLRAALRERALVGEPGARAEAARIGLAWAEARRPGDAAMFRRLLAGALLAGGDAGALAEFERLAQAGQLDAEGRIELAAARARAGQRAEAIDELRGLVSELDRPAAEGGGGGALRPGAFWLAWAALLEMLEAEDPGPSRAAELRLRIRKLELIDAGLGGGPAAERIRALQRRLP